MHGTGRGGRGSSHAQHLLLAGRPVSLSVCSMLWWVLLGVNLTGLGMPGELVNIISRYVSDGISREIGI